MRKIKLSQGRYTLVDNEDYNTLSQFKWYYGLGYAIRGDGKKTFFLHHLILPKKIGLDIDHINRNKLDNRRNNLRYCTRSENKFNGAKYSINTSGYRGVTWHKYIKKWQAQVTLNYKNYSIGYFDTALKASKAYKKFINEKLSHAVYKRKQSHA